MIFFLTFYYYCIRLHKDTQGNYRCIMPEIGTGINPLRSLVFVRKFGGQIVEKTNTKYQSNLGNIAFTAIDAAASPKEISFRARNNSILIQAEKNAQDRLIDIMA